MITQDIQVEQITLHDIEMLRQNIAWRYILQELTVERDAATNSLKDAPKETVRFQDSDGKVHEVSGIEIIQGQVDALDNAVDLINQLEQAVNPKWKEDK